MEATGPVDRIAASRASVASERPSLEMRPSSSVDVRDRPAALTGDRA
ncbi:hypothetical protein [Natrinema versiforme]|nr:hypothetical protein [Natrinema versiforme]